jgi:imidazolonepropionase-like amidohydrolase
MTSVLITADAAWHGGRTLRRDVRILAGRGELAWHPSAVDIPADAERLHLDGVVVPGFVDHHVHIEHTDVHTLLAGGLSGVRDLGASPGTIFDLARRSVASPRLPRITAAGPILTAVDGYPSDRDWAQDGICQAIHGPEEARIAVRVLAGLGATAIKVALHSETSGNLTDEELRTIVRTAHLLGLTVVAHAEGADEPERAQRAGVDELAHTPWTTRLDDKTIRACAATMTWVSTIDTHGWGADTRERRTALDNLRRFRSAGGRIRYGTDLGNGPLPAGINDRELAALSDAGYTPNEILASIATSRSDLTVVAHDPLVVTPTLRAVCGSVRAATYLERNPVT